MPNVILAKQINFEGLAVWECQLCKGTVPRRTQDVTPMMIHLVQVHLINLSLQSFPPGILQTGAIFHVCVENIPVDKYKELFERPLQPLEKC